MSPVSPPTGTVTFLFTEDAAWLEGYYLANQRRSEPEIYERHFEPFRARWREALGDRADALVEEGRAMDHSAFHAYALRVIDEAHRETEAAPPGRP